MSARTIHNALTVAGSDSGGGAGIQADLKTFAANGVYGASVITAVTAQNTHAVVGVVELDAAFVHMQLKAVFDDIHFSAVKTGMLPNKEIITVVAEMLASHRPQLVIDPVMVSTSGHRLMDKEAAACMIQKLFPLAVLVTPNLPEAAAILDQEPPDSIEGMKKMAVEIYAKGPQAVLLKGGHLEGSQCIDLYYDGKDFTELVTPRVITQNTHGTGCVLSSAITAQLAKGETLIAAITNAKTYVTEALRQADKLNVGDGHGPVNHFYAFWNSLESSR